MLYVKACWHLLARPIPTPECCNMPDKSFGVSRFESRIMHRRIVSLQPHAHDVVQFVAVGVLIWRFLNSFRVFSVLFGYTDLG